MKTMTNEEIIREIRYLVDSEPNDQSLGIRIREFINHLDIEEDHGMRIQPNFTYDMIMTLYSCVIYAYICSMVKDRVFALSRYN